MTAAAEDAGAAADPAGEPRRVLQQGERLSRALIWDLQRAFFAQQGMDAWRRSIVPHYITSNPFIADACARVVAGYLADRRPALPDPARPVHIVELGGGPGRFAFHFLRRLAELQRRAGPGAARFKYVITDLVEPNVAHLVEHPQLRPFVEQGLLDFGRFDVEHDTSIRLVHAGDALGPGALENGLVVLANYFFDGIPQDAFRIRGGALFESLVTVSTDDEAPDPGDPALLARVALSYEHRPAEVEGYYGDPDFERILRRYRDELSGTAVAFPVAALRACRLLRRLSGGQMLLVSADKGYVHEDDLLGRPDPGLAFHGSFSMSVNYHALAAYFRDAGGDALHPAARHAHLLVAAFLLGEAGGHPATRSAFADAVEGFGPDDFYLLQKSLERSAATLSLEEILAAVRLGRSDSKLVGALLPALSELAPAAGERQRQELFRLVEQAWATYFHLGEESDLAFGLGMLLYDMAYHREAIVFFQRSLALYGPDAHAHFNVALCHHHLREADLALEQVEATLALQPDHEPARALRLELRARGGRRGR